MSWHHLPLNGAVIVGPYRYWLARNWDATRPRLVVCMLNPSTADHEQDDMTIRTLRHFATLWGYGGLIVVNLAAFRTPSPAALFAAEKDGTDIRGPELKEYWARAIDYARTHGVPVLCAWGNNALAADYLPFREALGEVHRIAFGLTGRGEPIHPAARGKHRIARDAKPMVLS